MRNYIWQTSALFVFLTGALLLFYLHASSNILWAVGAGSLASSAYIVFSKPSSVASSPLNMLVAYVIAIVVGIFFRVVVEHWWVSCADFFQINHFCWPGVIAALAVVVSLLIMAAVRIEHPPAAGMALILVLDVHDYQTLVIILMSVVVLALLKRLLKPWLKDLF